MMTVYERFLESEYVRGCVVTHSDEEEEDEDEEEERKRTRMRKRMRKTKRKTTMRACALTFTMC